VRKYFLIIVRIKIGKRKAYKFTMFTSLFIYDHELIMKKCKKYNPSFIYDPTSVSYLQYMLSCVDYRSKMSFGFAENIEKEHLICQNINKELCLDIEPGISISSFYKKILKKILGFTKTTTENYILVVYPWDIAYAVLFCCPKFVKFSNIEIDITWSRFFDVKLSIYMQGDNRSFPHALTMEFVAGYIYCCELIGICNSVPILYEKEIFYNLHGFGIHHRYMIQENSYHSYKYTIKDIVRNHTYGFHSLDFLHGIKSAGDWVGIEILHLFEPVTVWEHSETTKSTKKIKEFRFL
jgi:hypothetical protein